MKVLEVSASTTEYLWFPAKITIDGVNYQPENPQISFAFVAPNATPTTTNYNNGFTGNLQYASNGKPAFTFLFTGSVVGIGRYDLWLRCVTLGETVSRKVAEVHVK